MMVFCPLNGVSDDRWRTNVLEIILSYASFRSLEPRLLKFGTRGRAISPASASGNMHFSPVMSRSPSCDNGQFGQ